MHEPELHLPVDSEALAFVAEAVAVAVFVVQVVCMCRELFRNYYRFC
jgi:hypothetical protein